MKKGKGIALLPIGVFLVLYLGLGILFEYVMGIPMGFYNVPTGSWGQKYHHYASDLPCSRFLCRSCGKKQC